MEDIERTPGIIIYLQQRLCHLSYFFVGTVPESAEIGQGWFELWKNIILDEVVVANEHHSKVLLCRIVALLNRVRAEHPANKPQRILTVSYFLPFSFNYPKCLDDGSCYRPYLWCMALLTDWLEKLKIHLGRILLKHIIVSIFM